MFICSTSGPIKLAHQPRIMLAREMSYRVFFSILQFSFHFSSSLEQLVQQATMCQSGEVPERQTGPPFCPSPEVTPFAPPPPKRPIPLFKPDSSANKASGMP